MDEKRLNQGKEQVKIANRLVEIIKSKNMSKTAFCKSIGYANAYSVSRIISGEGEIRLQFILRLKTSYPETNLNWLFTGKGDMYLY